MEEQANTSEEHCPRHGATSCFGDSSGGSLGGDVDGEVPLSVIAARRAANAELAMMIVEYICVPETRRYIRETKQITSRTKAKEKRKHDVYVRSKNTSGYPRPWAKATQALRTRSPVPCIHFPSNAGMWRC